MTNMRPKTYFLRPDVAIPLGFALLREFWAQKISGRPDKYDPFTPCNKKRLPQSA